MYVYCCSLGNCKCTYLKLTVQSHSLTCSPQLIMAKWPIAREVRSGFFGILLLSLLCHGEWVLHIMHTEFFGFYKSIAALTNATYIPCNAIGWWEVKDSFWLVMGEKDDNGAERHSLHVCNSYLSCQASKSCVNLVLPKASITKKLFWPFHKLIAYTTELCK